MKIAVVGSRPFLKRDLCVELANQEIGFHIDAKIDSLLDPSFESKDCDFQDIVACERFLNGVDCVVHTGLNWRGLKQEEVYSQINDIGCIVNEAIKQEIRIIFLSDALTSGYHAQITTYDESKLWNQSIDWSLAGFMYHFAEREVFRGIVEGIEAIIIRPSLLVGSESDKGSVSHFPIIKPHDPGSNGILSIVSRTDIVRLIIKLIGFDSFKHRFLNCSGHSIEEARFSELVAAHKTPDNHSGLYSSILNYFKKTPPPSALNRPFGLNISYDNQRSIEWLGMEYLDLETTIADFQ